MRRAQLAALIVLVAAGALALRLPRLNLRPAHGDEAVHTYKFNELWKTGRYVYDSYEYHGPTLYYFTLPVVWASGADDYGQTSMAMYRLVPVLFGVGLILLLWLLRDGLGAGPLLVAAVLTALSPAMVFYSRYYIQEMLLAFFALGAVCCGWRYVCSKRTHWALLCGACLGLMHATKETCVISYGCMALALVGAMLSRGRARLGIKPGIVAAAVGVAVLVSAVFLSGFFSNLRGPLDSVLAYEAYLGRAAGNEAHVHPWYYYLRMLAFTHYVPGPWWSEGLILVLAAVGVVAACRRTTAGAGPGRYGSFGRRDVGRYGTAGTETGRYDVVAQSRENGLLRFLAMYGVLMTAAYSAIPYKTPWCLIQFLQPLILLAGVGTVALLRWLRTAVPQAIVGLLLIAATVELGGQACAASFRFCADRRNPYVYAHPLKGVERLTEWVEKIAAVSPDGHGMLIRVITPNSWPLPWYLRRFERVGYWEQPPADCDAPVVIVSDDLQAAVAERLRDEYQVSYYGLRPDVVLVVYVKQELWEAFAASVEESSP